MTAILFSTSYDIKPEYGGSIATLFGEIINQIARREMNQKKIDDYQKQDENQRLDNAPDNEFIKLARKPEFHKFLVNVRRGKMLAIRVRIGVVAIAVGVVALVMPLFEHSVKLVGKPAPTFFDTRFGKFVSV